MIWAKHPLGEDRIDRRSNGLAASTIGNPAGPSLQLARREDWRAYNPLHRRTF